MISVCITTYNGEKHIQAQLESIICQLKLDDEIIISDDGSTDKTIDIINSFNDTRIKIFNHIKSNNFNKYPFYKITKNVENALKQAKGDLIFLADQDDIWVPTKVQTVIQELVENLCLLHDCIVVDEDEHELISSYYKLNKSQLGIVDNIFNSSYLGCCMVIRKELLLKALPFPVLPVPHDIWLGLIAEWKGKMILSNQKLLKYRRHGSNLSTSSEKSHAGFIYKIQYRFYILFSLLIRMLLNK